MSLTLVVAGTDTGVGKTVFAAALVRALAASYWKPVQAGMDGETDSDTVRRLSGAGAGRIISEAYRLTVPASPHYAALQDGVEIDRRRLDLPATEHPLIVEAAGGLMVPLRRDLLQIDVIESWHAPVVLCARTTLGTINHTLLSVEALRLREIALLGIAFIGAENRDSETTICDFAGAARLGRLPIVDPLNSDALARAFSESFDLASIAIAGSRAA